MRGGVDKNVKNKHTRRLLMIMHRISGGAAKLCAISSAFDYIFIPGVYSKVRPPNEFACGRTLIFSSGAQQFGLMKASSNEWNGKATRVGGPVLVSLHKKCEKSAR